MHTDSFLWRVLTLTIMFTALSACGGSDSDSRPGPTLQEQLQGYWHGVIDTHHGAALPRTLTVNMGWVVASTINGRSESIDIEGELRPISSEIISLHRRDGLYAAMLVAANADAMLLLDETLNISVLAQGAPQYPAETLTRDAINGNWQGTALTPDGSGKLLAWPEESTLGGLSQRDATMQCTAEECLVTLDGNTDLALDFATQKRVPGLVEFNGDLRVWDGVEVTDGISQRRATLLLTEEAEFAGGYICPDKNNLSPSGCIMLALTRTATSG